MKSPLFKRIPRELKGDFGKYVVIFLFMIIVIGFISGFLVAANSLIAAFEEGFTKYNCEWGHFITKDEPGTAAIESIEDEADVSITKMYYVEATARGADATSTLRIYQDRDEVNLECLMSGELPVADDEIAIDRMYAENNSFNVGDTLIVGGKELRVSGYVAFPDYSCLFSDNSDMMFDSVKFGVGVMTKSGYESYTKLKQIYDYAWVYNNPPADDDEEMDMSEDLLEVCVDYVSIDDYLPRYANQAIQFTREDFGSDSEMMKVILYVLIVVMAFIFSITIKHTITKESSVIGTLRASGYTRGEVLRHYLALPMIVTFVSAIIGNILGYTVFKDFGAAAYYGSYSLPTFVVLWNAEAFLLTTIVPIVIMFVINYITLHRALRISPLKFIRRDLGKTKRKKAIRLPRWGFFSRFRLRIIFQNMGNYVMLLVGVFLADVFLMFGMMMGPLLSHYQGTIIESMPSKYQYILKTQVDTETPGAEKFSLVSTDYYPSGVKDDSKESITAYGISDNSAYIHFDIPEDGVVISDGIYEKYGVDIGDELVLHESYGKKEYRMQVVAKESYPSSLAVFMTMENFYDIFEPKMSVEDVMGDMQMLLERFGRPQQTEYFNAYFSDEEIKDIDSSYILTKITEEDLTKVSRQLDVSMGALFQLWNVFAVVLFILLIYLLTKLVIEKNSVSISMVKILGYRDGEISKLYLMATTWVVVISMLVSYVVAVPVMTWLYHYFMQKMSGWMDMWIGFDTYVKMFLIGLAAYAFVALIQFRKIRKIPMDEALKSVE